MDNQQATDIDIGWLAGIIDGEGWLGISVHNQYKRSVKGQPALNVKVELKINNCDEAIVDRVALIMAKLGVNAHRRTYKNVSSTRRLVHEVATKHMTGVGTILAVVAPYLTGNKQERAALITRYIGLRKSNPGIQKPSYPGMGRAGSRTVFPYTQEELALVRACRDLQCRGASETTRATREKVLERLLDQYADYQIRYAST